MAWNRLAKPHHGEDNRERGQEKLQFDAIKFVPRNDKALLLNTARAVFDQLWSRKEGTSLRLRWPSKVGKVNTGGWRAIIGSLGKGKPKLQLWLDRFAGHQSRKFNFCFFWDNVANMRRLTNRAESELPIRRRIRHGDMSKQGGTFYFLKEPLRRNEFGGAVLEEYWGRWSYFGIYDLTSISAGTAVDPKLVVRAAAFFETFARAMPRAESENEERDIFPRVENRKVVASHLHRERSRYLATERKILDGYSCQVCRMHFEKIYGKLGAEFAEAHHIVPLSQLRGTVKTCIEDLRTVCANCHRMLHRLDGKPGDMDRLRRIVRVRKG